MNVSLTAVRHKEISWIGNQSEGEPPYDCISRLLSEFELDVATGLESHNRGRYVVAGSAAGEPGDKLLINSIWNGEFAIGEHRSQQPDPRNFQFVFCFSRGFAERLI